MSKELIKVLRGGRQCDMDGVEIIMSRQACIEAADRIEELERECDGWKASAENRLEIQRQREDHISVLLSDNARLREALERIRTDDQQHMLIKHEALAPTPAQGLARVRNYPDCGCGYATRR